MGSVVKTANVFTDSEIIQIPAGNNLLTILIPDYGDFHPINSTSYLQHARYTTEKPQFDLDIPLFSLNWCYTNEAQSKLLGRIALTGMLTLTQSAILCQKSAFTYIRTQLDADREKLLKQHEISCKALGLEQELPEAIGGPDSAADMTHKRYCKFSGYKTLLTTSANETGYHVYFIPLDSIACLRLSFSPSDFDLEAFDSLNHCRSFIESLCDEFISKLTLSDGNFTQVAPPPKLEPSPEDLPDNSW